MIQMNSEEQKQFDSLVNFVRETAWMARRYATTRQTYAPHQYNMALHGLIDSGLEYIFKTPLADYIPDRIFPGGKWAWDGALGEWDEKEKCFVIGRDFVKWKEKERG